jgi:DNA-binding transcriptional ArsR family regulator
MSWALGQQEVKNPTLRFLLLCIANYASTAGRNAFPSAETLTEDTGLSESTVRRGLDKLEELGVIIRGNQEAAFAEIKRHDRLPTVYDLPILRGVTVPPRKANGVSTDVPRGVTEASTGCQAMTPDPKRTEENKSAIPALPQGVPGRARDFETEFARRFGKTPDEAHSLRKTSQPKAGAE